MWVEKSSEAQNKIKSDWYIKTFPENHFNIDLILAQFYLYLFGSSFFFIWPQYMLFGQNDMSFEKKRKLALNSLTKSYITVIILFCYLWLLNVDMFN